MADVSIIDGQGNMAKPAARQWRQQDNKSLLQMTVGNGGTYIVGVSTKASDITLSADEFNDYLKHDGVVDILQQRRQQGLLEKTASERYAKHVKTILQVGDKPSDSWSHYLDYPLEIIPLQNPNTLCAADTLAFKVVAYGLPVVNQQVYASYAGYHQHDGDVHREAVETRTDADGIARIKLASDGRWYLRLIRMLPSSDRHIDYQSNWATLTFDAACTKKT